MKIQQNIKNLDIKYIIIIIIIFIALVIIVNYIYSKLYENFDMINNTNKQIIVYNFSTNWCGHCKEFQPIWNQFVKTITINDNIKAIDVKCDDDNNKILCNKYKVPGYPSIVIIDNNKIINYSGSRTVDGLRNALNLPRLEIKQILKTKDYETPVIVNNEEIKNNKSTSPIVIYNFNTEWCGYSKRFQPVWDQFSNSLIDSDIKAIDIKCDNDDNIELCNKFNIDGYPSIIIVKDNVITNYLGPRTVEGLNSALKNENNLKVVYNFNTEWCSHSVNFQPIWNTFSNSLKLNDTFKAIDVKCDNNKNKELCDKYNIEGYPSIIILNNDEVINYNGPRTVEGLNSALTNLNNL